ncbi:amidohydrolase 3 [Fusarium austroafricanum]|uniref:Amidohydrolase 3 n=1 Tax=Fusarium austroafricanum TaxID=2364996 RepID=A0A8H4KCJ2_9HYPO|nr:amidohydrolase 3 [Fusarium austroafricanum]
MSSTLAAAYHSGNVYTVSEVQPRAEAFVVSADGLFSAVGTNAEILQLAREQGIPTVDLRSQFVMPGIHDAHVHLLMSGLSNLSHIKLGNDPSNQDVAAKLRAPECQCQCPHAYGDWLVGDTFKIQDFDRSSLDTEFPETPVAIRGGVGHAMFMNTAALKRAGYDTEAEPNGKMFRYLRRQDGQLTGEVAERGMEKALLSIPKPDMPHVKRCIQSSLHILRKGGVTSAQEAATNSVMLRALNELDGARELKMDVQTHIAVRPMWLAEESEETIDRTLEAAESYRSEHVQTNFIKLMLDGVPMAPYFTHCGLTESGQVDESKIMVDNLADLVTEFDAKGLTCKIHCTGQGSTRRALDVYEALRKSNPKGPRHEVAHCNGVHDGKCAIILQRFKSLGITAEMSPSLLFPIPTIAAPDGLATWDFAKMIKHGAHITIGSDYFNEDPSPMEPCAAIVDNVMSAVPPSKSTYDRDDKKRAAGEAIIRMLTLSGAEAIGRDHISGSIEVGKKANFIMVDRDLSKAEFRGARVLGTWFEGERVWDWEEN